MAALTAPSGCDRGPSEPALPPATAPAPVPAAGQPQAPAPPPETATTSGSGDGTGGEAAAGSSASWVDLGEPLGVDQLPEGWPRDIPLPEGAEVTRLELPDTGLAYIEAVHAAPAVDLLDWYASVMGDLGWLVIQRDALGPSARIRLALDRQRWLVVVGQTRAEDGAPRAWINIRRLLDEEPLEALPIGSAGRRCEAALPPTERSAVSCVLEVGPVIEGVPIDAVHPDAAFDGHQTALLFLAERSLMLVTLRGDRVHRGPRRLLEVELETEADAFPQLLPGVDGGWLVSWIEGDPPERRAAPWDRDLRRADRTLRLSRDLGVLADAAWAPTVHRERYPEYAAAWVERLGERLVFRIAGVKRDADRVRRSGRFPIVGGRLERGPVLVSDGEAQLALLWGASEEGVLVRMIGTDGLPDAPERQLEPGVPSWLRAVYGDASYWVVWGRRDRGFWVRATVDGCLDDARGSLGGEPLGAWAHPLGPLVLARREGRLVLVRLSDDGGGSPVTTPEVLGSSRLEVRWADFDPSTEGLRGVVRLPSGLHPARWVCEEADRD